MESENLKCLRFLHSEKAPSLISVIPSGTLNSANAQPRKQSFEITFKPEGSRISSNDVQPSKQARPMD